MCTSYIYWLYILVKFQVRPIVLKDFEAALKFVRPSVSQNDLKVYVDWNLQYGSGGGEP